MQSNETAADKEAVFAYQNAAQDALNRMRRAAERGTGCHLTADMIAALEVTVVGSLWDEPDPRDAV